MPNPEIQSATSSSLLGQNMRGNVRQTVNIVTRLDNPKRLNGALSVVIAQIKAKVYARETGMNGKAKRIRTRKLGRRSKGENT